MPALDQLYQALDKTCRRRAIYDVVVEPHFQAKHIARLNLPIHDGGLADNFSNDQEYQPVLIHCLRRPEGEVARKRRDFAGPLFMCLDELARNRNIYTIMRGTQTWFQPEEQV